MTLLAWAGTGAACFWSAGSGRELLTIAAGGTGPQRDVSQDGEGPEEGEGDAGGG